MQDSFSLSPIPFDWYRVLRAIAHSLAGWLVSWMDGNRFGLQTIIENMMNWKMFFVSHSIHLMIDWWPFVECWKMHRCTRVRRRKVHYRLTNSTSSKWMGRKWVPTCCTRRRHAIYNAQLFHRTEISLMVCVILHGAEYLSPSLTVSRRLSVDGRRLRALPLVRF